MEEKLTSTRLLVSFINLNDDKFRDEQDILELALQYEIIPLSKFEKEILSFNSSDNDFISATFLNDLVAKGYNDQAVLEVALKCNVLSVNTVTSTIYCFEASDNSIDSLCIFIHSLLVAGFDITCQMIL